MKTTSKIALLCSALLLLNGCALFGDSEDTSDTAVAADTSSASKAEQEAPKNSHKDSSKSSKGATGEAAVKADLDVAAHELVGRASRTVVPSKAKPSVAKSGKQVVVNYVDIDTNSTHATLRKGSSAATPYTAIVSYSERHMRCTGATKAEALSDKAQCQTVKTRHMQEFIRYDGKKWVF